MLPRKAHLLCNAHLDPVWLWEWEEGAAEAISTFRTAAELCEEYPAFVFNHNEAILYKWIQEYDPGLFKRIQTLVRKKRWHIMGGWYLQPDCNMTSGESLVRQILSGRSYFKKHFCVDVKTAMNFDTFGHSRGLVQILAKSGYDSYLFGRPFKELCKLPAEEFVWVGFDGSEVLATRFECWYNSELGKAREKIERALEVNQGKEVCIILWGVGNHGGGPSRRDLRDIERLIHQRRDCRILHSTPEAYFADLKKQKESLPRYAGNLNHWGVGCYTSQIRLKQKHRMLENELYSAEKMLSAAYAADRMEYPSEEIRQAAEDLMFSQFHDILPGTVIQSAEAASLRLLEHGLETTARLKARAFFAIAHNEKAPPKGTIPLFVFNPHPYRIRQIVEAEFNLAAHNPPRSDTEITVFNGRQRIPAQTEKEQSNLSTEWRKRVVFDAVLEPGQLNRFHCRIGSTGLRRAIARVDSDKKMVFKTELLEVHVNKQTGLIDRYAVEGTDYLKRNSFEPLVLKDSPDPWDMLNATQGYREVAGRFTLMSPQQAKRFCGDAGRAADPVRIIEDGEVRTVIEAYFRYGQSCICQRYKLPKAGTEIELEVVVYWNEKDRLLKLSVPIYGPGMEYIGQTAYGVSKLAGDGSESVAQKWTAVVDRRRDRALTCINSGTYSSDFSEEGLRLTLLRSPMYSCAPSFENEYILPEDRFVSRIDQGERRFQFWFNAGDLTQRLDRIDREALAKNEKPYVLSFFPKGDGETIKPVAILEDDVVQMTAIKKAEKGRAIVIRLYEPTGRDRRVNLRLPVIGKRIAVSLTAFEVKTFKVDLKKGNLVELNLIEESKKG